MRPARPRLAHALSQPVSLPLVRAKVNRSRVDKRLVEPVQLLLNRSSLTVSVDCFAACCLAFASNTCIRAISSASEAPFEGIEVRRPANPITSFGLPLA